ncbi:MAG: hypothetical protein FWC45_08870 [Treponema sp.]|nr:hypothetical protein [Treponema sp.]
MKKILNGFAILGLAGLILAGCSNPVGNDVSHNYDDADSKIKSGDFGSARIAFNGTETITEMQEVTEEKAVGTGEYEFVDPALKGEAVDPAEVQFDDVDFGPYVMRTTDATQVITGYNYYKYEDGKFVEKGKDILSDAENGFYVINETWTRTEDMEIEMPSGNGETVEYFFEIDGSVKDYKLTLRKTSGNIASFTFNFAGNVHCSTSGSGDPLTWKVLPESPVSFEANKIKTMRIYAEIRSDVRVPVTQTTVKDNPIWEDIVVVPVYDYVDGEPVREAVYELTEIREITELREVEVQRERLSQNFDLTLKNTKIASANVVVDKDAKTFTITFSINELIPLVPEISCALTEDGEPVPEDFVAAEDLEVTFDYVPGTNVFLDLHYKFL